MSYLLRIALIVGAVCVMVFMINRIRQAKLKIEYIVFWIAFSVVLVIMGVFPQLFYAISALVGFQSPVNMVFLVIIFVLIVKLFYTTIQISQLENKIDSLAQEMAVKQKIEKDMNQMGKTGDK